MNRQPICLKHLRESIWHDASGENYFLFKSKCCQHNWDLSLTKMFFTETGLPGVNTRRKSCVQHLLTHFLERKIFFWNGNIFIWRTFLQSLCKEMSGLFSTRLERCKTEIKSLSPTLILSNLLLRTMSVDSLISQQAKRILVVEISSHPAESIFTTLRRIGMIRISVEMTDIFLPILSTHEQFGKVLKMTQHQRLACSWFL